MRYSHLFIAALASLALGAPRALAGDDDKDKGVPPAKARAHVLVVGEGDGVARFDVDRDATLGRMTFTLADPAVKIDSAPVVVMSVDGKPREVALTAVEGHPGTWTWTNEAVKAAEFDGTLRVVVAGKTYTSPLSTVWVDADAGLKPRYGGRVVSLTDCGTNVEVVQDCNAGTLTVYPLDAVALREPPMVTVTQASGPTTVTMTKMDGKDTGWIARGELFKTVPASASIKVFVKDKPCEAPFSTAGVHGGQIVAVEGGPSFEVVREPTAGTYTFYAIEDTYDGKAYTIENPTVMYGERTYRLTRVENEPRAWRLVGLDTAGSTTRDGQLNFTLFGKTLSTKLGLSGLGVGVK